MFGRMCIVCNFIKSWELQNQRKFSPSLTHSWVYANIWMALQTIECLLFGILFEKVLNIFSFVDPIIHTRTHEHSLSQFIYLCRWYKTFYSYLTTHRHIDNLMFGNGKVNLTFFKRFTILTMNEWYLNWKRLCIADAYWFQDTILIDIKIQASHANAYFMENGEKIIILK